MPRRMRRGCPRRCPRPGWRACCWAGRPRRPPSGEFGCIGRQAEQGDVVGQAQALARLAPAGGVADHQGMGARCHHGADLPQVLAHRLAVHRRHDDGGTDAPRGADGAEQVHAVVAIVANHRRAGADRRPNIGMPALLAHSGLILEPDLDRLARGRRRQNLRG